MPLRPAGLRGPRSAWEGVDVPGCESRRSVRPLTLTTAPLLGDGLMGFAHRDLQPGEQPMLKRMSASRTHDMPGPVHARGPQVDLPPPSSLRETSRHHDAAFGHEDRPPRLHSMAADIVQARRPDATPGAAPRHR